MLAAAKVLGFLSSGAGRIVMVGLALAVWTAYIRLDAANDFADAQLLRQLEESNRLLIEARDLASRNRERADEREAALAELKEKADAVLRSIPPGGPCTLPDDLLDGLREIR